MALHERRRSFRVGPHNILFTLAVFLLAFWAWLIIERILVGVFMNHPLFGGIHVIVALFAAAATALYAWVEGAP